MLVFGFVTVAIVPWIAWTAVGTGLFVMALVITGGVIYGRIRWRRRILDASAEEDLPWDQILGLIDKHNRERAATGLPPEEVTKALLDQLVTNLPAVPDARPVELPEDREFETTGGAEKRSGRRRWGNPTEILLRSYLWTGDMHGLVVNRSTGGLGMYVDDEIPASTPIRVRAVEAPANVAVARAEVRHCRKVGRGYYIGCEFVDEIPWNVRVWFG